MTDTMKAAVLHRAKDLRIDQLAVPQLEGPDYCLVEIGACGICGSDIHFYEHGRIGDFVVETPMTLGHEAAGTVVEIGDAVESLQPGDRVAIEPGRTCRKCEFCKSGRYNLCADVVFLSAPPYDAGGFAEYIAWPEDYLFKLPDDVSLEAGGMIEPFSVGLHAARRAAIGAGDSVLVTGAGPIGLCALQAAKACGAVRIFVSDMIASRLQAAEQFGADAGINITDTDITDFIADATDGRGVDVVLECSGVSAAVHDAVNAVKRGGTVQLVGNFMEENPPIPIQRMVERELTVSGLFRYVNTWPAAIDLADVGAIDLQALVTHRFPLDEAQDALEWVEANKNKALKGVILPHGE